MKQLQVVPCVVGVMGSPENSVHCEAIDQLPDLYRDPFVMRDLEEMSTADVARVLGIEPATVRQRVHRARLMLRGYLGALAGVRS